MAPSSPVSKTTLEFNAAELLEYPRLAHLARALHEQRLALGGFFPSLQRIPESPFHDT